MLTHPTLDQLRALGFAGMSKAIAEIDATGEAAALTHLEWLGLLLDRALLLRWLGLFQGRGRSCSGDRTGGRRLRLSVGAPADKP